ncbi:proline racemase family protein [Stenotrophomonas humi]
MKTIHVIDSHTAGEPTRVVMSGFPDLGQGSLAQRREIFRGRYDHWRSGIACEPRGSDTMVGALLLEPTDPRCCAGVIFFNNVGYLGMCGHGTIGLTRTLAHVGRIQPGEHLIETPVGVVGVTLHVDGKVSIDNVESYRFVADAEVEVPGIGKVKGDIAWGGNWFFITKQTPAPLDIAHRDALSNYTIAVQKALEANGIRGEDGGVIDHVEISGDAPDGSGARNFVMCPGGAYDRSPCGTGTSAKIACLAADGELAEGERWVQQGILGSAFEGSYRNGARGVMPTIIGQAWITGTAQILIEESDPLAWGIGGVRP